MTKLEAIAVAIAVLIRFAAAALDDNQFRAYELVEKQLCHGLDGAYKVLEAYDLLRRERTNRHLFDITTAEIAKLIEGL